MNLRQSVIIAFFFFWHAVAMADTSLEQQVNDIFKDCKKDSAADLYSRIQKLRDVAGKWSESLSQENMKKHIYEYDLEGQVFTLFAPYVASGVPLAELAKTCWEQYEDWRRSYRDNAFDDKEYADWKVCLSTMYTEEAKLSLVDKIDSCRSDK